MQKLLALLGAKNKEEFVELFKQFVKFGLVGVSNTAVSMAVYYIFLWISPDLYMVGSILGTILSIANAFFWNDKFALPATPMTGAASSSGWVRPMSVTAAHRFCPTCCSGSKLHSSVSASPLRPSLIC
mgnify:CR=1 FL=1